MAGFNDRGAEDSVSPASLNVEGHADRRQQAVLRHSPLDVATAGDMKDVEKRLGAGVDPDVEDPAGEASLHDAAKLCKPELAELLLSRGADPNARNNQGKTPADLANCPGKVRVFKRLLAAGAGPQRRRLGRGWGFRRELDLL